MYSSISLFYNICIFFLIVPVDGVKGKTWGPSTVHQKERGHSRRLLIDGNKRWSKSAPNLEKTQRGAYSSVLSNFGALPECG